MDKTELPKYIGKIHPNCDYHHGQIFPAKGVKTYQVARANTSTLEDDKTGYTYKHAPDLAYFHGRFYIQYLTNPVDEHAGAGISVLASSKDGYHWTDFLVSFPKYQIPACTITNGMEKTYTFDGTTYAYMHQRMSFYYASNGKMLLSGFYGWSPQKWMTNWNYYGIGRVIRELYPNGTLSPIYFILPCPQGGWNEKDYLYPFYTSSTDHEFVKACEELLSNSLYLQQWAEENGDKVENIQIKHPNGGTNEAFCWYHLDETSIIGLWKHSKVSRSNDNGRSWMPIEVSHSLVMSGQKVWGCKTTDGKYAMVYDPTLETQHRYPLCVTTSLDGILFDHMKLVHGEVPMIRYKGFWKDLGPQYVRGITEGNPLPKGQNVWVTYSVNKEDIWISEIPIPIEEALDHTIKEDFLDESSWTNWNVYCPKWAKVEKQSGYVLLENQEPCDYAKLERVFLSKSKLSILCSLEVLEHLGGNLELECTNQKEQTAVRLIFHQDGYLYIRTVTELKLFKYEINHRYEISLYIDCEKFRMELIIDGNKIKNGIIDDWSFMMAVNEISRFFLRTGERRWLPTLEQNPDNLPEKFDSSWEKRKNLQKYHFYYLFVAE